jgi:hypothetical protein
MNIRTKIIVAMLELSAVGVFAQSGTFKAPTSDEALRARFLAHRVGFERLIAMANKDSHLTRIAPDFTWLDDDVAWPRKNVGISEERWNDYRQTFRRVGDSEGILKGNKPARIMFPMFTVGLVPSGAAKGLVYSQELLTPVLKSLDKGPPEKFWDGPDHAHVLAYKPIADHWYIYYEQW